MRFAKVRRVIALSAIAHAAFGCTREDASAPASPSSGENALDREMPAAITVTASRRDLVFSYPAEDGRGFATTTTADAIPEQSRSAVVVTDLSLTPEQRQSGRYVYIADLRAPREDGSYPVAIASRYAFEAKLSGTSTLSHASPEREVIVYTTEWCGVCRRAKQLLRSLDVSFKEKDIEGSRSAAIELHQKASRAGLQPGGVPVIDVAGALLQGLDEPSLRSLLRQKGFIK